MKLKKRLATFVHGWLPKEPNLPVYQRTTTHKTLRIQKRFAVLVIIGAFMGALFGASSSFIGLSGLGAYIYFMIIGMAIGIVVATILIRMKQKEEQQRS
jgi:uncharacterized membrane protein